MSEHLWEINHPYHCSDTNYYVNGYERPAHGQTRHDSWAAYIAEFGLEHTDMDYNLVFRWDWKPVAESEDEWSEYEDSDTLHLYHMQQRRGNFQVHIVRVNRDDEPEVRKYLSTYAEHMRKIWEPFL